MKYFKIQAYDWDWPPPEIDDFIFTSVEAAKDFLKKEKWIIDMANEQVEDELVETIVEALDNIVENDFEYIALALIS